jgi:LacI family transcriptional regulator
VIPNIANAYFATLAKGIDDIADMYKYNIVLANSDENDEKEINVVNTLFSKQVDGIIFMGYHLTDKIRAEFSRSRTPIVLAGTVDLEHQLPSVNIDYAAASSDAVKLLAKNNKKSPLFQVHWLMTSMGKFVFLVTKKDSKRMV